MLWRLYERIISSQVCLASSDGWLFFYKHVCSSILPNSSRVKSISWLDPRISMTVERGREDHYKKICRWMLTWHRHQTCPRWSHTWAGEMLASHHLHSSLKFRTSGSRYAWKKIGSYTVRAANSTTYTSMAVRWSQWQGLMCWCMEPILDSLAQLKCFSFFFLCFLDTHQHVTRS